MADDYGKTESSTVRSSSTEIINRKNTKKTDYVYKATDGTLVKVVFTYGLNEKTIAITHNKKTFTLEETETLGEEIIYKKDDMTARVKGDSLLLEQGSHVIELRRTKI